jgi:5-methylcytosine-specific restriction endonuclease McrA
MAVFVLDKHGKPLMPCSEKRARQLLDQKRARIHRMRPFTIRLVDRKVEDSILQPIKLKIDPGSKGTGIALVRVSQVRQAVLMLMELKHRGADIRDALTQRRAFRCRRRGKLRFREQRFDNRTRHEDWLAPSLWHRVDTTMAWVDRLSRLAPVTAIDMELVRFDTQLLENPEICGVEYQQGTLAGYEVREYCLEKWGRQCMYCGKDGSPLQVEHIVPRARGGSDRPSNLGIACEPCNQAKGSTPVEEFVRDPKRLVRIQAIMRSPMRDAAAVNSTRWALFNALKALGLPVSTATGSRTKWNRSRFSIPKTHSLDAACVGHVEELAGWSQPTLQAACTGRGRYKRTLLDKHGFPRGRLMVRKRVHGFATGDLVAATVAKGKKIGSYVGRVAVRASGKFNITTAAGVVQGIGHRNFRLLQRADGYGYSQRNTN